MDNNVEQRARLAGSLLLFTRVFYELRTGRQFRVSKPDSRESHHLAICRELTKVQRAETAYDLLIAIPPRYGKTELLIHFIAWCIARYPDSNFLYVSNSYSLAEKSTQTVREIISLPEYRDLFGVHLKSDSKAKGNFETEQNGSVYAVGAGGTIIGRGAGIKSVNRFGGAIIIDDIITPEDALSDTVRAGRNQWYFGSLQSRKNNPSFTPIIIIGQRTHEDDLAGNILAGFDGRPWNELVLPALDVHGHALDSESHTTEQLLLMKEKMPYEFAAQYQQDPQPAGGGLFKPEWFVRLDDEPTMLATFITVDTAETDKNYNDATVFSFWGLYKIEEAGVELDTYGLHWIDCYEDWIEPKDLKDAFMHFYSLALRHPVKPKLAAIEKKSTGVTLYNTLKDLRGINVIEINRNQSRINNTVGVSKAARFLKTQEYAAAKLISLPKHGRHTDKCIEHMRKITINNTHRYDDIADTFADAVRLALIDNLIMNFIDAKQDSNKVMQVIANKYKRDDTLRSSLWRR